MKFNVSLVLTAFAALTVSGCATKYQEMGLTGGVQATRISSDTAQITARGNGYTDADAIQRYGLRKAAQTTVDAGFDVFEIIGTANRTVYGTTATAQAVGGYAVGSSWQTSKPGETFMIKMYKGAKPESAPSNWHDARDILKFLGSSDTNDKRVCREESGKVTCE